LFFLVLFYQVVASQRQPDQEMMDQVLDQLRGALPYHGAIRGTIITTGGFAQGCKDAALFPGAAPITLIDGDKVIELLLKHGVGVKKKPQTLIEIDESYFASDDPETEITEEQ
jgi:restriction system protein